MFDFFKKKVNDEVEEKAFELTEEELQEIEQFNTAVNYKPSSKLTVVYMPGVDFYDEDFHFKPKDMLKALANLGVNVIYINSCYEFYQVDDIEKPYPELPNFSLVRKGVPCRSLYSGRVIYWVNNSEFSDSVTQSRAHLIVYQVLSQIKFPHWDRDAKKMERIADILLTPLGEEHVSVGSFSKNHLQYQPHEYAEYDQEAIEILKKIEETPNRPPLLE